MQFWRKEDSYKAVILPSSPTSDFLISFLGFFSHYTCDLPSSWIRSPLYSNQPIIHSVLFWLLSLASLWIFSGNCHCLDNIFYMVGPSSTDCYLRKGSQKQTGEIQLPFSLAFKLISHFSPWNFLFQKLFQNSVYCSRERDSCCSWCGVCEKKKF